MLARAIVVSVDFPIPGEPPISTSEPGTRPPPSTLSSSPIPVESRACSTAATSPSATGLTSRPVAFGPPARDPALVARRVSSTSEFHSPQPGHWPDQRGDSWAQAEQTWTVVARAIASRLGDGPDGTPGVLLPKTTHTR